MWRSIRFTIDQTEPVHGMGQASDVVVHHNTIPRSRSVERGALGVAPDLDFNMWKNWRGATKNGACESCPIFFVFCQAIYRRGGMSSVISEMNL
jgi:hypothetical protein